MANVAIDEKLLEEALKIGGLPTKKATVTEALEEYVRRRKQARIVELFDKIDYYPPLKKSRAKR
ncbi:MAG TPA: type II toxin-antitoxin system VapB family antitoxin [Thermoanaerobaculia bacterium]|nr:type II toxin-antitoxin system VapB family antitoxin [Thermoanaerobaculia bacterium]